MNEISIEELKTVPALSDLPDEHLKWILDHSDYAEFEDGQLVVKTGEPIDFMWILIEGGASFYMDVNGKLVHYFDFTRGDSTGGVGGLLPYSRMKASPGYSYAVGKVRSLMLHKKHFPELEQLNPAFIQRLVGYMTDRARLFAVEQLQQEKVSALGKLAAGIAHELNNPASAVTRLSDELKKRLFKNYELTEKLLLNSISHKRICEIRDMVKTKSTEMQGKKLTALQRMEKEDDINDLLEKVGMNENNISSEIFVDAGITQEDFEKLREGTDEKGFIVVLQWLENLLDSERLIKDLSEASSRISNLVGSIKSHVHMDRTNDIQPTDLNKDIDNTLTLLGYKLREKNISVKKLYDENLPPVEAFVGELNQVWTNLIDNAIFAIPQDGELTIQTYENNKDVKVKIIDNGSGIPPEIISRIFDPFFTTKKVGEGTGIGLDLVNRIVKKHQGDIKVNSVPGRTEFMICLPVTAIKESKDKSLTENVK